LREDDLEPQSPGTMAISDVIIVGGGPAGATLAVLLGRAGFSVELFERGRFPKEKPCGEGLMPAGIGVLARLGLAETVGGFPFYGVRYHNGQHTAVGRFPAHRGLPAMGRGQRRRVLDQTLFAAAAATPGVTAHTGATVDSLLQEAGRVAGVCVGGQSCRARLVVAADGAQSRIRAQLGWNLPLQRKRIGMRAHFRLAAGREHEPWVDIHVAPGRELYVTPLPAGELLVAALSQGSSLQGEAPRAFHRWLRAQPDLTARLEGAEQITDVLATSPLACGSRCGVAEGIVLLGDAAGSCDPVTGGGIAQALVTAELLAAFIARRGLAQQQWLPAFQRARRAALRDYRRVTAGLLWLTGHPRLARQAVRLASHAPRLVSHLVGVAGGARTLLGAQFTPVSSMRV